MTKEQAVQKMMQAIGGPVRFGYPGGEGIKWGVLKDREVLWSGENKRVQYWDVVDLIEFPGEPSRLWKRIGYYRQVGGRLRWASQTTITEPLETWERIHAAETRLDRRTRLRSKKSAFRKSKPHR